ncbi:MAG: PocR ligand-binding domain-containing protein [Bacillota bacterium]|nr:PocR ligand-binding domain-containing protein [Bacillota bacterium]
MEANSLEQLVDREVLDKILKTFTICTGLRAILVDVAGKPVLSYGDFAGESKFCEIICKHAKGLEKCQGSYARAGHHAAKFGKPYIFRCHSGLVAFAAPIVIDGKHLGSIICGQVLMWEPEDFFWTEIQEMNKGIGIDIDSIIQAAKGLEVVSSKRVQAASDLLFVVANHIMATGITSLRQRQEIAEQQARLGEEIQARKFLEATLSGIEDNVGYSLEKEKELMGKVRLGDVEGAKELLEELLAEIVVKGAAKVPLIKARIMELVILMSRASVEAGADGDKVLELNNQYIDQLSGLAEMDEVCQWVLRVVEKYIGQVKKGNNVKNRQVVDQVTKYIRDNYQQNPSLEEIASQVYLSPYYLSHVFKQEMGCTVMDYFTSVKMEAAKKLLRDPKYNVVEVSEKLGYNDPSYFTKVFKKKEGITPTKFKQKAL